MYGKFEKKTENSEITMTNDMKIILKKKEKKKNDYEKIIILSTDDDKCEWEEIETKNQQRYFCFERVTFH